MTSVESRRLYSWWWNSHISPKNSKWLQEDLTDMDMKVKAMIKLIEEDADSFARRAEMYYKKRPELMKLVEEFYRAYRALAERYDHATGALRHAHRTMSEALPNHIPFALPDEFLSNNTTETPSPRCAMFDTDDLPNDDFDVLPFIDMPINREGVARVKLPEGNGLKGLDVHEEEVTAHVRLPERKAKKSLNFEEDEEKGFRAKVYIDSKRHVQPELKQKDNVTYGVKHFQEQVSLLSNENQKLKAQIELESKHLDLSRGDVQNLRDEMSKLESEKDAALLQKQLSHERISSLETEISKLKDEIRKLNEEMEMAVLKLSGAEQQCLALEKANHSLQLELEGAKIQLEELRHSLNESDHKRVDTEMSLQSMEQLYNQFNEKVMLMTEKLKEVGRSKVGLEEEVSQLKDINYTLNEHNLACALKMKHLEDEIVSLKEINDKLEDELEIQVESKKILQQEYESLKDNQNEMELNNQSLTKEMEAAILRIESLESQVKDMQYGNAELKECCSKLEDEKLLFLNKLKDMESVSERNSVLENILSDANVELEELREKREVLEGSCESLNAAVSTHVGEKTALAFQIETLVGNVEKLSVKNTLLENSLDDANSELEGLRSKLRNLEESYQSLSHANSDLISQKNNLISQVVSIQQSLTNFETTHAALKYKHLNLVKEKDLSVNKILNLEDSLNVMQKEHELLIHSKNTSLATLENQLLLLLQDRQLREQELEAEHQRCFSHMTDIFVLQRCLHDMSNSLRNEKQKYKSLVNWSEIQLAALGRQINLLQEQKKVRDNKIEEEEQKYMNSMDEIFILQNCLSEMKRENLTLLQECQKHLESSRHDNERIKHLEDRELVQKENISLLMSFTKKLIDSSEKLHNLMEEKNSLEEENSLMCMNAMTLENLYLFFRSLNAERTQQLKLVSGDMCSILTIKNGLDEEIRGIKARVKVVENENMQLKESLVSLEELRSRITISEYDLQSSRSFCEELILLVENGDNLLEEKIVELSKVNDMLQSKQEEVTEVCRKLEVSNKEVDEAKIMRSELEKKITVLLEGIACKDNQIAAVNGENGTLNEELNKLKVEVEAHKMREQQLSCELQEEKKEVNQCEKEIMELFSEVQASVVNATMFEEKMFELASRCEGLDISSMVLRETLKEEIILKNTHAVELKKKLDDFENENEKLRTNLKVLSPLFFSLGNGISDVEKQVCQLETLDVGYQENSSSNHQENHETSTVDLDHSTILGVLEMQNFIAKVEALQKLVVGTKSHLDQERLQSAAKLESARREIEELKQKESSIRKENQGKETSNMVKDIELDEESSSFRASRIQGAKSSASRIQGAKSNDQMVKSWEVPADTDDRNRLSIDHGIESVEEVKSEKPSSEIVTEKDFGVHKMEISREIEESKEEWNRRVIKRLTFDAEKLSSLHGSAQELKLKMEKYDMSARQNRMQFDTLKAKLKDAKEAILDLIDKNGKLIMMVEAYCDSYDGYVGEEIGPAKRSQVLEQAQSASDRIGMLELELHKIDYIFLKLQEEWESYPTRGGDRTPRVLLRDYLYGRKDRQGNKKGYFYVRKDRQGKKKGYFCGCMRPRTQDNN